MKKSLTVIAALILFGIIAFVSNRRHGISSYALASVDGTIRKISSDTGSQLVGVRSESWFKRGSRFAMLDRLSNELRGRPLYNDIEEYWIKGGSDTVKVKIFCSHGNVVSVEIRPSLMPSKLAENFKSELATSYAELDCQVKIP